MTIAAIQTLPLRSSEALNSNLNFYFNNIDCGLRNKCCTTISTMNEKLSLNGIGEKGLQRLYLIEECQTHLAGMADRVF